MAEFLFDWIMDSVLVFALICGFILAIIFISLIVSFVGWPIIFVVGSGFVSALIKASRRK